MDRGYDDNKFFNKLFNLNQDFIIRLKSNRKLHFHGKWIMATELMKRRKGKVKLPLYYKGKEHELSTRLLHHFDAKYHSFPS